jgi:hypothetical protein
MVGREDGQGITPPFVCDTIDNAALDLSGVYRVGTKDGAGVHSEAMGIEVLEEL